MAELSQREHIARIIDAEAFERYDPDSKSMFRDKYKERVDAAYEKADQILAFLTKEAQNQAYLDNH